MPVALPRTVGDQAQALDGCIVAATLEARERLGCTCVDANPTIHNNRNQHRRRSHALYSAVNALIRADSVTSQLLSACHLRRAAATSILHSWEAWRLWMLE